MKILWIEDFGGKAARSKIVVEIFNELFEGVRLEKEYDQDNPDVAGQLFELFRKHTLHEVYLCGSFVEWKQLDARHQGDFDIALIDINLESEPTPDDEKPEGTNRTEFDKKAGFYIYHQLIKRGFPDDNIAFFTGEGQSLKDFSHYCGDIFLDKPAHCFQKNPSNFKQLRNWLAAKTAEPSLILRRGVIDGCRFMKAKIEALEASDLESQLIFYKTTPNNASGDAESLRRRSLDYMTRLQRLILLPHANDKTALYRFTRELAAHWEESTGYFMRTKPAPRFGAWLEAQFHNTAQFQMRMLRNWTSHPLLSTELTPKEIAYFFMLAMRSLIETKLSEIAPYEEVLLTLFTTMPDLELNRLLTYGLEFHLEQSYEQLRALHTDLLRHVKPSAEDARGVGPNRRIDNYFLALFKETGELVQVLRPDLREFDLSRIRAISLRLFYQSFWHGLFPLQIKSTYYANLQSFKFNLEPLQASFLSCLGRAVFEECFRENEASLNVA
jgi:hypothetical protein